MYYAALVAHAIDNKILLGYPDGWQPCHWPSVQRTLLNAYAHSGIIMGGEEAISILSTYTRSTIKVFIAGSSPTSIYPTNVPSLRTIYIAYTPYIDSTAGHYNSVLSFTTHRHRSPIPTSTLKVNIHSPFD